MISRYGAVSDWATDLAHADPDANPDAGAIWAGPGDGGCPVAHSDRYAGCRSGSSPLRE